MQLIYLHPTWTSGMQMKMQINYSIPGLYAFFITFQSKYKHLSELNDQQWVMEILHLSGLNERR